MNQNDDNSSKTTSSSPSGGKKSRLPVIAAGLVMLAVLVACIYLLTEKMKNEQTTRTNYTTNQSADEKAANSKTVAVTMTDNGFSPSVIKVKAGSTVVWTNKDSSSHQIAADSHPGHSSIEGFDSTIVLATNDTLTYVFEDAGTYNLHDEMNPATFRSTVIVE